MESVLTRPQGPATASAVLAAACDGYAAGTTGRVTGHRQGCLVFAPDAPERHAKWANARASLLVPPGFVATVADV